MLAWLKSAAFVPVIAMLVMFKASALLALESVTVCGALLVPSTWSPKLKLVDDSATVGACNRIQIWSVPCAEGTARSSLPSPLKSPTASDWGWGKEPLG